MQLIVNGRFVENTWRIVTAPAAGALEKRVVVPIGWYLQRINSPEIPRAPELGVLIDLALPLASWQTGISSLPLVILPFASSSDGRGFSVARALRESAYRGELRARGALIVDQYVALLRCGFNSVEIDTALARRQSEPLWRAAYNNHISDHPSRRGRAQAMRHATESPATLYGH